MWRIPDVSRTPELHISIITCARPPSASSGSAGTEVAIAFHKLMVYLGHDSFDALMSLEIGGGNDMQFCACGLLEVFWPIGLMRISRPGRTR